LGGLQAAADTAQGRSEEFSAPVEPTPVDSEVIWNRTVGAFPEPVDSSGSPHTNTQVGPAWLNERRRRLNKGTSQTQMGYDQGRPPSEIPGTELPKARPTARTTPQAQPSKAGTPRTIGGGQPQQGAYAQSPFTQALQPAARV